MPINPAFHRHPVEAAIIGRLVVAFGELEVTIADLAGELAGNRDLVMRIIYNLRTTSSRIETADILVKNTFNTNGLSGHYEESLAALRMCLVIRNRYAHCHWLDDVSDASSGLYYTDLQDIAKTTGDFTNYNLKHVDVELLADQENYFTYCLELLIWLRHELAVRQKVLESHIWPKPTKLTPPKPHNPSSQHVPPWLSEDHKAQHLARAWAAERGDPTPTPAQIALEEQRAAKRAKKQADRDRDVAKRSEKPDGRGRPS